jgi:putative ABC transport system permease protein
MLTVAWMAGLIRRRWARLLGVAAVVALVVAQVALLGAFVMHSNARMTTVAARSVPVDWQVQVEPNSDVGAARRIVATTPGVVRFRETGYGDVASFSATTGASVQVTGAGKMLGLPTDYAHAFPGEVRTLSGSGRGILLFQQTAANLHVAPGDAIVAHLPSGRNVPLHVDGIVDLPQADSLFQTVGAPPSAGATAPPDNVAVVPLQLWETLYASPGGNARDAGKTQFHVNLSRNLPSSPADAFAEVIARAHNLEARLAGTGAVGDNLAAMLDAARTDALYSELLFLFLGLPGVLLAWLLAIIAGSSGRGRRRREQAILRIRGASLRQIAGLSIAESLLVSVLGIALGVLASAVVYRVALGARTSGLVDSTLLLWTAVGALSGLVLSGAAVAMPALRDARLLTVRASSIETKRAQSPLWERLYLDVVLLLASGLVFWQSTKDAYQVVLVPEGVPTISVNYLTLLGPFLLWAGFALFAWRLADKALLFGRHIVGAILRPLTKTLSGVAAASMARQRRLLSRGLVLIALSIAFAFSVAIFNTTYMNQARVDAQLTNGADVAVNGGRTGVSHALQSRVGALPGVSAVQPMQHRLAYVGTDLQDLYGIDPTTIGNATPMSDAFFQGGNATAVLGRLAATPDGVLVSEETVKDFQLQQGDAIRLRLQGPDHAYHVVPFRYVGVAREFPTAPHDSFLVANRDYVARKTGISAAETLLVRTSTSPREVAIRIRGMLDPASPVVVKDLDTELRATLSSLTAVDLTGLTRLELFFAVLIAAASSGLILWLGFVERKRSFAILHALGARRDQVASFVWAEALYSALGGAVLGAMAGWLQSYMLVKVLTGVFDPPPESLSVPTGYLSLAAATAGLSIAVAAWMAVRAAQRPAVEVIRDL